MADFVSGDTGSKLVVTCKNNDGTLINLSGSTVKLKWRDAANTATIVRTMTVTSAAGGVAEYQFATGELFAKEMAFEVEITDATGKILRSLDLLFEAVREALAA